MTHYLCHNVLDWLPYSSQTRKFRITTDKLHFEVLFEVSIASYTFNFNEFIFVEVMFFEISENKISSKITRYTVCLTIFKQKRAECET